MSLHYLVKYECRWNSFALRLGRNGWNGKDMDMTIVSCFFLTHREFGLWIILLANNKKNVNNNNNNINILIVLMSQQLQGAGEHTISLSTSMRSGNRQPLRDGARQ